MAKPSKMTKSVLFLPMTINVTAVIKPPNKIGKRVTDATLYKNHLAFTFPEAFLEKRMMTAGPNANNKSMSKICNQEIELLISTYPFSQQVTMAFELPRGN